MSMFRRRWPWLIALFGVLVAALTATHLAQIPQRIPLNYNEGWMAFFAARAVDGGTLYPPPGSFISNNYPPLSFYLFGAAGKVMGDQVFAGRAIALLALIAVAGEIFWSARRLGAGVAAATTGALLFALFNLTWFSAYVAMADPQWLGQAVMLAGLPLLLQAGEGPLPLRRAAASALLMVAGGFIKHNLLALPLAAGLWLLVHDRRAFLAWGAAAVAGLAAGALWLADLGGRAAFIGIFGGHRRWLPEQLPDAAAYLAPMLPLVAATVWLARRRGSERRIRLIVLFAAMAAPLGVIQRLGEGVNVNGHFEVLVALCIAAAAVIEAAPPVRRGRTWSRAAIALALAAPMLVAAPYALGKGASDVAAIPARRAAWSAAISAASVAPGPVACEMLSVCYWAGKGFELDFFNYGQDLRAGASPQPLEETIEAGRFGAIVLARDAAYFRGEGRLPAAIARRIEAAYAVRLSAPGHMAVMTPKLSPVSPGRGG
ncbi:MAG TPA: hypothetical protein VL358_11460 [Caulobacteraceae bacterium]|jgi:hypothetical protein|nr:hypothetical protein [Caulobacteraceae bacterium]